MARRRATTAALRYRCRRESMSMRRFRENGAQVPTDRMRNGRVGSKRGQARAVAGVGQQSHYAARQNHTSRVPVRRATLRELRRALERPQ